MQLSLLQDTIDAYQRNLQLTSAASVSVWQAKRRCLAETQQVAQKPEGDGNPRDACQFEHAIAVLTGQLPSSV